MVLITEPLDPVHFRRLEPHPVCYAPGLSENPGGLREAVATADALVIRNRTRVDANLLACAPRLKVVGRLGSGLDNIDRDACRAHGVKIISARGANADAVADCTLLALLLAARPWNRWLQGTRAGRWERTVEGRDLYGQTLAIIGFGAVGRAVAARARGFGLRLVVFDPRVLPGDPALHAFDAMLRASPAMAVSEADFVTLHLPLTAETYHLVNAALFARFRPGAWLINTSRGALVDESALLAALDAGRLAGAFLDVRETEPPPPDDTLHRHPRVLSTPHVAGLSRDAQERVAAMVLDGVAEVLRQPPRV